MPPLRARDRAPSATSSGASASYVAELVPDGATLQLGIGAIPSAVALALDDKRDLGIHTEMFTDAHRRPRRVRGRDRGTQGAQPRQDRDRVHDGHAAPVRLRGRQPDGRDALGRLHQRHPRHPLVQPDDGHQLGHRGRPDRPGRAPTPSATGCTAASAARWTSSAARRWPRRAARSSRCRRPPPVARARGSRRPWRRAPASSRRAPTFGPSSPSGASRSCFGRSVPERARALIAIAHPDFRDRLRSEARATHEL